MTTAKCVYNLAYNNGIALAKPSYCDVARHHFKDVLDRPTPPVSPPVPDQTSPQFKTDSERPHRLIKDESRKDDKGYTVDHTPLGYRSNIPSTPDLD